MDAAGNILDKILRGRNLEQIRQSARLEEIWSEVVGATVAAHSRPEGIRGTSLTVVVDSATWSQQLQFFKDRILARIREESISVEHVRFRVGNLRRSGENVAARPRRRPLGQEEIREIEAVCDGLKDARLRKEFDRLMRVATETGGRRGTGN